jgi:hypothetical protein
MLKECVALHVIERRPICTASCYAPLGRNLGSSKEACDDDIVFTSG